MANDYCFYCSTGDKKIILNLSIFVQDATSSFLIDIFGDSADKFIGITGKDYENILKKR